MSKSSITLEGCLDAQAFAQLLEDLAKSFKAGCVCLQKGQECLTLKPCGDLEFELEASAKKSKQKLSLEVIWQESARAQTPETFTISQEEPVLLTPEPCPCAKQMADEVPAGLVSATDSPAQAATPQGKQTPGAQDKKDKPVK